MIKQFPSQFRLNAQPIYRKSSIRSRPCIISNPKFPRLVLEVFQKLQFLEQNFLSEADHKGPNRVILKDLNFCQ